MHQEAAIAARAAASSAPGPHGWSGALVRHPASSSIRGIRTAEAMGVGRVGGMVSPLLIGVLAPSYLARAEIHQHEEDLHDQQASLGSLLWQHQRRTRQNPRGHPDTGDDEGVNDRSL